MHAELQAKGARVSEKRVARLMRENGLRARQKRRFRRTTDSNHADPIAPNVFQRDFEPDAPNQSWATDVTYVHTAEWWLYLAVMLDLFSRRVVGWAASATNDCALALAALHRSLSERRPEGGLVHHSDRGSPNASQAYRQTLAYHGIVPSMSRTGDCSTEAAGVTGRRQLAGLAPRPSTPPQGWAMLSPKQIRLISGVIEETIRTIEYVRHTVRAGRRIEAEPSYPRNIEAARQLVQKFLEKSSGGA